MFANLSRRILHLGLRVAAICALGATASASATTITNVATVEWDVGQTHVVMPSNAVTLTLDSAPTATAGIYQLASPNVSGATQQSIPGAQCQRADGSWTTSAATGAFAALSAPGALIAPATGIYAGQPIAIMVNDPAANLSPTAIDTLTVTLTSASGDRETLNLQETSANSGTFAGVIATTPAPPAPVIGDCRLSVTPGTTVALSVAGSGASVLLSANLPVLIDPFGTTFDSGNGAPVSGTRITLVDAATGQPATVYGDDGVSLFPSTIVTGTPVTDAGGTTYNFPAGFYRFPFAAPGTYRLVITPPDPYHAPSAATAGQIAALTGPGGQPYTVAPGSYGQPFTLTTPEPVRFDVPLDRPGAPLILTKIVSSATAQPGDALQYRITVTNPDKLRSTGQVTVSDAMPASIMLRANSVRYMGNPIAPVAAPNGQSFTVALPPLAPGESETLTYLAEVRSGAPAGDAVNTAIARDTLGNNSNQAGASVHVTTDTIGERFTVEGRVTLGACSVPGTATRPIAGVRILMEDGTYVVTDREGRYHFEGLLPGLHVVQIDPASLPRGVTPVDCARNTDSAGSAISRFVEGAGGILKRVDFRAVARDPASVIAGAPTGRARAAPGTIPPGATDPNGPSDALPPVASDPEAAGAKRNWLAAPGHDMGFLFPTPDHNPRARAVRVAFRHGPGQKVALSINGQPVDPLAFDGQKKSADGQIIVDLWRGVPLMPGDNRLRAVVTGPDGATIRTIDRIVHFATGPVHAVYLPQLSRLVADGITRPRIAFRLTDRDGHPIQNGTTGDFTLPDPYLPAEDVDAQQARQLSGLERAKPVWRVRGDDGIAYVTLAPTTASGSVGLTLHLRDGEVAHDERIDVWLSPGNLPWTVVGFAAGSAGFTKLVNGLQPTPDTDRLNLDGRVALYAKGRVTGQWLMTLAYDTGKQQENQLFAGTINPTAYYTVYADASQQRYDAASVRKLYLKLERPQFYALFGDYQTGFDETQLGRYQRAFNGIKTEYRSRQVHVAAFGADAPTNHHHDEIQGNGLSGPYALSYRDILANSETIVLQVRDRLRSNLIVSQQQLTRYVDYTIDYASGTIVFTSPVLSRDSDLNPQFIVADYEVNGIGGRATDAGARASWTDRAQRVRLGVTAIHDESDIDHSNLYAADIRARPAEGTEVRAEVAFSDDRANAGQTLATGTGDGFAWLAELEHHGRRLDMLAYIREQTADFGLGQLNRSEAGTRKFGFDTRGRITDHLTLAATAWQEDYLVTGEERRAAEIHAEWKTGTTLMKAGVVHVDDTLADGTHNLSTLAEVDANRKMLNGKLELDAAAQFALAGQDASVDFPTKYSVTARYAVNSAVRLIGGADIADGQNVKAVTGRLGFELTPWAGAKILATANQQDIADYGPRTFGAFGIAQSLQVNKHLSVDLSVDSNQTISGPGYRDIVNQLQPVATGGFVGSGSTITEDFVAVSAGATYRADRWSFANRAEYRYGSLGTRWGLTSSALRQIGDGQALGGQFSYLHAETPGVGPATDTLALLASWAWRPSFSAWSILDKVELRDDRVAGAVAGQPGPVGGAALLISGYAHSQRAINSFTLNYSPMGRSDGIAGNSILDRGELALFWGTRYTTDVFQADEIKGWSNEVGLDLRYDITDHVAIGGAGTVRIGTGGTQRSWSGGPAITVAPMKNSNLVIGYNFAGFDDRDFAAARQTRSGAYISFRLKFDQTTFKGLGL